MKMRKRYCICVLAWLIVAVIGVSTEVRADDPLYRSSITATDFDFITTKDPSVFEKLEYRSTGLEEMPDKRSDDAELFQEAFVFAAQFKDGTRLKLYVDGDFESQAEALKEARRYVEPLGRLPTVLRAGVQRLVIHKGGENTTAFSDQGLIVVYSDNVTKRISTHDLEETLFHESVHATWDAKHAGSEDWQRAQLADGGYLTVYGKENSRREDLAESAIFAFVLPHHPDRIPEEEKQRIRKVIPNRMNYIAELIPADKPLIYKVEPREKVEPEKSTESPQEK